MSHERRVHDVGEFGLISLLVDALPPETRATTGLEIGIGDDAAVWRPTPAMDIVVTTDSLVEDIHFRIAWTDWKSLGHKALAVNISDLAAMGATPKLAVITLGLRGDERVVDMQALYRGVGALARRNAMMIAGGDIVRSPSALTIHVTALGEAAAGQVLTRSGAEAGDIIAVTGTLGASAAGLRLLAMEAGDPRRNATTADILIQAHSRPEPRVNLGKILLAERASAAMDLSDGLLGDLPKILMASQVSAEIDARRVPVAAAVRALFAEDWLELATRGGEDYELLFTAPANRWPAIEHAIADGGGKASAIGTIVAMDEGGPAIGFTELDGKRRSVVPGAFDHFGATSS